MRMEEWLEVIKINICRAPDLRKREVQEEDRLNEVIERNPDKINIGIFI